MRINEDFIELCKSIITGDDLLTDKNINWEKMCEMAFRESFLPIFLKKYYKKIPDEVLFNYGAKANNILIKNNLMMETIEYLCNKIDAKILLGKGCSFSQYLYNDPLIRVSKDIDLFAKKQDQLQICKAMETLGFREAHFIGKKGFNKTELINFYINNWEKGFVKEGFPYIEIKSCAPFFDKNICDNGINNFVFLQNHPNIKTFDFFHFFILLNANIFCNFFSTWGVYAECKIRDILDLCMFYYKHGSKLNNIDFRRIEKITNYSTNYSMLDIIQINCNLVAFVFGKDFVYKYINHNLVNPNIWPEGFDNKELLLSEQKNRWIKYCEKKNINHNLFIN